MRKAIWAKSPPFPSRLSHRILGQRSKRQDRLNMASIIVFPTPATHRRLPHLPKDRGDKRVTVEDGRLLPSAEQSKDLGHANGASDAASVPANSQQLAIAATPQTLLLNEPHRHSPESRNNLTINTQPRDPQINKASAAIERTLSGTPGSSSLSSAALEHSSRLVNGQDDHSRGNHQYPPHPLNSPHSSASLVSTPHSALPPSGAIASLSSTTSSLQESKSIKHALYDAFGCLYHPVQHTHHPASTLNGSSSSSSHSGKLSGVSAAALRSGEVTPLMGISPRVSPMLRPHLGASAPITPLELSSEDIHVHGGYYFGAHGSSSTAAGSTNRPPHAQHHVPHHHTHHHASRRASSQLSTGSMSKYADEGQQRYTHHNSNSHNHSHPTNNKGGTSAGPSRRSSIDFDLSPTEHPVLCSLHTLSLTHPHPPCHYHPHLGHDLGHDRVSLSLEQSMSDRNGNHAAQTTAMQQPRAMPAAQPPLPPSDELPTLLTAVNVPAAPLAPSELLLIPPNPTITKPVHATSSPFPMDQRDDGGIRGMGHQGLV
ncbi:unnamed protein product [Mortierella alpina]